jgi:hypothetical protein
MIHAAVVLRGVRVSLVSSTGLPPPIRREVVGGRHAVSVAAAQRTDRHIKPDVPLFFRAYGCLQQYGVLSKCEDCRRRKTLPSRQ